MSDTAPVEDGDHVLLLALPKGDVEIQLFIDIAPLNTARLKLLAESGEYDGVAFHRVIPGFVAQAGDVQFGDLDEGYDPDLVGTGGSDLPDLPAEFSDIPFVRGIVGMARSADPDSANSQFFIVLDDARFLDGQYTAVGEVVRGMNNVDALKVGQGRNGTVLGTPDRIIEANVPDDGDFTPLGTGSLYNPLANFGPSQGWADQETTPRLIGDIDGDGAADIVGFGGQRTFSSLNDGAGGLGGLTAGIDNFAQAQAWRTQDGQTRLLGDVDGDGDDDIIGFGVRSGFVAFSNGDGTFSGFKRAVENFANAQGWRSDNDTPRVMGDVNGDGVDDIIGFGGKVTFTALGNGDGTFGNFRAAIDNFSNGQGWATNDTFLRLSGDVNGDGMDDLVGFGVNATYTAISNGDGTFGGFKRAIDNFATVQGWGNNDATPRAVADVNGDGLADVVGFGGPRTFASLGVGDGTFAPVQAFAEDFNKGRGWSSFETLPRHVADLDADGSADLIGFSGKGVLTRISTGESDVFVFEDGFGQVTVTDFDVGVDGDRLDFRGLSSINTLAQARAAANQDGADTVITDGADTIRLLDVQLADLTEGDFLFG